MKKLILAFLFSGLIFLSHDANAQLAPGGTFDCVIRDGGCALNVDNCSYPAYRSKDVNGKSCIDYGVNDCPTGMSLFCTQPPQVICQANKKDCIPGTNKLEQCNSAGTALHEIADCTTTNSVCKEDSNGASCVARVCVPNQRYCADSTHLALCNSDGTGNVTTTECGVAGIGHAQVCDPVKVQCVLAPTTPSTAPNQGAPGNGSGNNGGSSGTGSGNGAGTVLSLDKLLGTLAGMQRPGSLFTFGPDTKLGTIVGAILPLFYTLAGIILLVFMIMSGFKFLTSAGDAKKTEQAKGALTAAIMGFVIIIVAYFVTQIINTIFQLGAGI